MPVTMRTAASGGRAVALGIRTAAAAAAVAAAAAAATAGAAAAAAAAAPTTATTPPPPPAWRPLPATAPSRQDSSVAWCGLDRLCLVGGWDAPPTPVYALASRTWQTAPAPPLPVHHVQATTGADGCVWVAGAYTGTYPREEAVDRIWTLCADGGGGGGAGGGVGGGGAAASDGGGSGGGGSGSGWVPRPGRIGRPRGAGGAAWHAGKLYLVGGLVGGHGTNATTVGWTDVYDPATGEWAAGPDMPHRRDHFGVAVVGDRLFAAGGRVSGLADNGTTWIVPEVDVLDLATLTWLPPTTAPDLPVPRSSAGITALGGAVYVAGGEWTTVYSDVHALDVAAAVWRRAPSLVARRHGAGLAACGGALLTAGGAAEVGSGAAVVLAEGLFPAGTAPTTCAAAVAAPPAVPESAGDGGGGGG